MCIRDRVGANIGKFLNDVAGLVESKKATDIVDISNQSSKEGIRIVLELKKGADVENLKNMLYKKTRLEDTFGVNMLAVADGRPETLSLKQIIAVSYTHLELATGIPVLFGVITTENIEQAIARAGSKAGNKGYDCALSAIEMVNLMKQL